MRSLIRAVISFVTLALGTLIISSFETALDESGWTGLVRQVVRNGWSHITNAGYAALVWWAFSVLFGVCLTLWAEFAIKKLRRNKKYIIARAQLTLNVTGFGTFEFKFRDWVASSGWFFYNGRTPSFKLNDPKLSRFSATNIVVLKEPIEGDAHVYVTSSRPILWRLQEKSCSHVTLDFDLRSSELVIVDIIIQSSLRFGEKYGTSLYQWDESSVFPPEHFDEKQSLIDLAHNIKIPQRLTPRRWQDRARYKILRFVRSLSRR